MTVYQECLQELRKAGARVFDGYDVVTVRILGRQNRCYRIDRWRFNLIALRVHDRTTHVCALEAAG